MILPFCHLQPTCHVPPHTSREQAVQSLTLCSLLGAGDGDSELDFWPGAGERDTMTYSGESQSGDLEKGGPSAGGWEGEQGADEGFSEDTAARSQSPKPQLHHPQPT